MAIAIPLIGGVREAANNAKCRSNLKQLHTAIIAYTTGNKERFPNLAGNDNLKSLIGGGYIESESKLGICPGDGRKPTLPQSSYRGGPDLDGTKKLSNAGIDSESIVLADVDKYHQAGRIAILLDGSFVQPAHPRHLLLTPTQREELAMKLPFAIQFEVQRAAILQHLQNPVGRRSVTSVFLYFFTRNGQRSYMKILLRTNGKLKLGYPYNSTTLLHVAVAANDRELVQAIIKAKDIKTKNIIKLFDLKDDQDYTALDYAKFNGSLDFINALRSELVDK